MMKLKCVCCEKNLESLWFESLQIDYPEQGIWSGGASSKMEIGYGSVFDGETFVIAFCDECIKEKFSKGLIGKKIRSDNYEN